MFESTYAVFHLPWKSELGMTSHTRRSSSQVGKPRSASHCLQPARLAIVTPVDLKKKKMHCAVFVLTKRCSRLQLDSTLCMNIYMRHKYTEVLINSMNYSFH